MPDSYQNLLGALAVLISALTYPIYFKDVLKGETKPHAFSWLIWAILGIIAFFGQRAYSAGPGSWLIGFVAFACLVIFLLSLRFGERGITKFDWVCLLLSLSAVPLWLLTQTPLWSMILVSLIDAIGFLPTFRKTWIKPFEETVLLYVLSAVSNLTSIFALNHLSLTTYIYPTVLVFMNSLFVAVTCLRRKQLR